MKSYALDTNTISYLVKEDPTVSARLKKESDAGSRIVIPPMAYYEIKRGLLAVNSLRKMSHFKRFCEALGVEGISLPVLDKATYVYDELRRAGRLTSDADIIIAAFCIVNDFILVTHNTKHFKDIDGLKTEDWVQ